MIVIKKRSLVIVSVLIITAITFLVCFGALSRHNVNANEGFGISVVLDAGHGGIDGGVSGVKTGVKESELNLAIVKKLERYFEDARINVVLTRSTEAGLYGVATGSLKRRDMENRKKIINTAKPVMVISVHLNKYCLASRRGVQVFYKPQDDGGKTLANCMAKSFDEMEESVRPCNVLTGDYYILNCSEYPSVICECGFLSNESDEALLITEKYQEKVAYSLFKGAISFLAERS